MQLSRGEAVAFARAGSGGLKPEITIAPQREPVEIVRRKNLTKKAKLALMVEHLVCWVCGERLGPYEDVEFDHTIPVALGGKNDGNVIPIHTRCHDGKFSGDVKAIAKAKRLAGETGSNRKKRPIPSRPFPKCPRKDR